MSFIKSSYFNYWLKLTWLTKGRMGCVPRRPWRDHNLITIMKCSYMCMTGTNSNSSYHMETKVPKCTFSQGRSPVSHKPLHVKKVFTFCIIICHIFVQRGIKHKIWYLISVKYSEDLLCTWDWTQISLYIVLSLSILTKKMLFGKYYYPFYNTGHRGVK